MRGFESKVAKYFKSRVDRKTDSDTVGFHGTSLSSIVYAKKYGVLPGRTQPEVIYSDYIISPGDLYFWAIGLFQNDYDPFSEAVDYALLIAQLYKLAELLSLDVTNPSEKAIAIEILSMSGSKCEKKLIETGKLTTKIIDRALKRAWRYKGLVVGISKEVENNFVVEDVTGRDDGCRIRTSGGLPYKYITSIKAIGKVDKRELTQILR